MMRTGAAMSRRSVVQLRAPESEIDAWKRRADAARMSLSEYLRSLARQDGGHGPDECSVCGRRFTATHADKMAICRRCR